MKTTPTDPRDRHNPTKMAVLRTRLPEEVLYRVFDFAYGVPEDNKKRLLAEALRVYNKQRNYYLEKHYYYVEEISVYPWVWARILKRRMDPAHYEAIQYYPLHYRRTDTEGDSMYENAYIEEKVKADYPRNQLHMYKRYARQLEQKIKQLEEQLQKQKNL